MPVPAHHGHVPLLSGQPRPPQPPQCLQSGGARPALGGHCSSGDAGLAAGEDQPGLPHGPPPAQ